MDILFNKANASLRPARPRLDRRARIQFWGVNINCTKDGKQISLLQIFVYLRKMFFGRRRKWGWKIWVDIVLNILPEQLSRCQCTEGKKSLGTRRSPKIWNSIEKLEVRVARYFVFPWWHPVLTGNLTLRSWLDKAPSVSVTYLSP